MAGSYKPVEVGVCEEADKPNQGKWCYRIVTIPALTPPEQLHQVALERYLEKYGDTFLHHLWVQSVGDATEMEDDIPTSESEHMQ